MLKKGRKLSLELGLEPVNFRLGPWPVGDAQGMQIAIEMLRASQQQGRNSADYVQFESIRKLRSSYFNLYESGPDGCKKDARHERRECEGTGADFKSNRLKALPNVR